MSFLIHVSQYTYANIFERYIIVVETILVENLDRKQQQLCEISRRKYLTVNALLISLWKLEK